MIEIFKTDVQTAGQATRIAHLLNEQFASVKVNFDLNDCDKILMVQGITSGELQAMVTRATNQDLATNR